MTSKETEHSTLSGTLDNLIAEHNERVMKALRESERLNISQEDFRRLSFSMNTASFTLIYLKHIKEVEENFDYKTTENYIRFQKQQLESLSTGIEDYTIGYAQSAVISVLSTLMDMCNDK